MNVANVIVFHACFNTRDGNDFAGNGRLLFWPSRTYPSFTCVPASPRMRFTASSTLKPLVSWPSMLTIMSLDFRPAFSAGKPAIGEIITILVPSLPSSAPMPLKLPLSCSLNDFASQLGQNIPYMGHLRPLLAFLSPVISLSQGLTDRRT